MEPTSFDQNLAEDAQPTNPTATNDHGWHKVTYVKRHKKPKPAASAAAAAGAALRQSGDKANVFRSIEEQSEDRRRRIVEAQRASNADLTTSDFPARSRAQQLSDDEDDSDVDTVVENGALDEVKKLKPKKQKKPKISVADAAAKIDASDLAAFLADITGSYETQQDIQMMRFADYFGRAFSGVGAAQFPWMKMFRESTVAKIADIPISHISDAVYKTSVDWINQRSPEALGSFVLWSSDSILVDLVQQAGVKGSKKGVQQVTSKSQVAIFVVLALVLRRKPDVLINVLPTLRETSKYQGQDKLPVIIWMIAQTCQGDLAVGLYLWAHILLPMVSGKSCNPLSRDMILQLVERILSAPKARQILVNGAVRKGERLIPPSAFETLMRVTFPASSAKVKATERFEAIYPTLKEVALAGSPRSKGMKPVSQQILCFAAKVAGESVPELSKEATGIFIWCLTQNADCYKQWDQAYEDNLGASVAVLKKLSEEWREQSVRLPSLDLLRETLKNFRHKNEKELSSEADAARQALSKDADKYCKAILGKLSRGHGCIKGMAFVVVVLAVGAAVMSPNMESWDWTKLSAAFSSQQSF